MPIEELRAVIRRTHTPGAGDDGEIDPYTLQAEPKLLHATARAVVALVPTRTNTLASAEAQALPLAAVCSQLSRLSMRHVGEATCEGRRAVRGGSVAGERTVVLVLLSGDGASAERACHALRDQCGLVSTVISVLDTDEGARRRLDAIGVSYRPLATVSEIRGDAWKAMLEKG